MNPAFPNLKVTGPQLCPDKRGLLSQLVEDNLAWDSSQAVRIWGPQSGREGKERGKLDFEGPPSTTLSMSRPQHCSLCLLTSPALQRSSEMN